MRDTTNYIVGRFVLFHTFHKLSFNTNEQDLIIIDLLGTVDHNLLVNNKEFMKIFDERYKVISSQFTINYHNGKAKK